VAGASENCPAYRASHVLRRALDGGPLVRHAVQRLGINTCRYRHIHGDCRNPRQYHDRGSSLSPCTPGICPESGSTQQHSRRTLPMTCLDQTPLVHRPVYLPSTYLQHLKPRPRERCGAGATCDVCRISSVSRFSALEPIGVSLEPIGMAREHALPRGALVVSVAGLPAAVVCLVTQSRDQCFLEPISRES